MPGQQPKNQRDGGHAGGLPPVARGPLRRPRRSRRPIPASRDLIRESIEDAAPRPADARPTRTSRWRSSDAIHPPDKIDPDDPIAVYDELHEQRRAGDQREGSAVSATPATARRGRARRRRRQRARRDSRAERKLGWMLVRAGGDRDAARSPPTRSSTRSSSRCRSSTCASPTRAASSASTTTATVLTSQLWWQDVFNTLFITVISVAIELVLGMLDRAGHVPGDLRPRRRSAPRC